MTAWLLISIGGMAADIEEYQIRCHVVQQGWRLLFPHQTPESMHDITSCSWGDVREHKVALQRLAAR